MMGQTIQSFPSGLVRVDATFVVPNAIRGLARDQFQIGSQLQYRRFSARSSGSVAASPDRPETFTEYISDDEAPAYIFPSVRESNDVPGFTKFIVSAYGRDDRSQLSNTVVGYQPATVQQTFTGVNAQDEPVTWTIIELWRIENAVTTGVMNAEAEPPVTTSAALNPTLVSRRIIGTRGVDGAEAVNVEWQKRTTAFTRRNFGRYHEYDITENLIPLITEQT
jgi:hypothetical protein